LSEVFHNKKYRKLSAKTDVMPGLTPDRRATVNTAV